MFSTLFFFLAALLAIETAFSQKETIPTSFTLNGLIFILSFIGLVALFFLQAKLLWKKTGTRVLRLSLLGQCELIGWLLLPLLVTLHPENLWIEGALKSLLLLFYVIGAALLYLFTISDENVHISSMRTKSLLSSHILFLSPFTLSFILFTFFQLFIDSLIAGKNLSETVSLFFTLLMLLVALLLLSLMAPFTIKLWGCKPLSNNTLKERLETLCQKVGFHHRGLMVWGVMSHAMTAAIFGFLPRLRYILFTQPLLTELTPEEVEAVLAHELGHYHYKHLLIYPFIFLGAGVGSTLLFQGLDSYIETFLRKPLFNGMTGLVALFLLYILVLSIYIRVVFGFFSRRFERAADLFPLRIGMQPHHLLSALKKIGFVTSTPLNKPNWHHGSLKRRIENIENCWINPLLIKKYESSTKLWLLLFFFCLFACLFQITLNIF